MPVGVVRGVRECRSVSNPCLAVQPSWHAVWQLLQTFVDGEEIPDGWSGPFLGLTNDDGGTTYLDSERVARIAAQLPTGRSVLESNLELEVLDEWEAGGDHDAVDDWALR